MSVAFPYPSRVFRIDEPCRRMSGDDRHILKITLIIFRFSEQEVIRIGELLNSEELSEEILDTVTGGAAREMILLGGIIVSLVAVGACRAAYLSIKKD